MVRIIASTIAALALLAGAGYAQTGTTSTNGGSGLNGTGPSAGTQDCTGANADSAACKKLNPNQAQSPGPSAGSGATTSGGTVSPGPNSSTGSSGAAGGASGGTSGGSGR
jgi:hypothetical protein